MGGLSGILGHLEIADDVFIGAHTLITKSINESGNWCLHNASARTQRLGKVFSFYKETHFKMSFEFSDISTYLTDTHFCLLTR